MGSNSDSNIQDGQTTDANPAAASHSPSIQSQTAQHPEYLIDNAELLLKGTYTQVGFDLVITGPSGEQVVIGDYFTFQPPPNLMFAPGLGISPEMVEGLLVQIQPEYQVAGPAPGDAPKTEVGEVTRMSGKVFRTDKVTGEKQALSKGDTLYKGDILEVEGRGYLLAKMNDGTRFNLGRNSRAVLQDYSFNEQAETGSFSASVLYGGFKYKSGLIGKFSAARGGLNNHATISTPSAVIGIRGSELEGSVDPVTFQTTVIHRSGFLTVTDINGNNPEVLAVPGNTATIVLGGNPQFVPQASSQQQSNIQEALPPAFPEDDGADVEGDEAAGEETEQAAEGEENAEAEGPEGDGEASEGPEEQMSAAPEGEGPEGEGLEGEGPEGDGPEGDGPEGDGPEGEGPESPEGLDSESGGPEGAGPDNGPDNGAGSDQPQAPDVMPVTNSPSPEAPPPTAPPPLPIAVAPPVVPPVEIPPDNPPTAAADFVNALQNETIDLSTLLLENDNDPESQILSFVSVDTLDIQGSVAFDATAQTISYTPDNDSLAAGETQTDTFTYTIQAGNLRDTATVTVTVTGENDAPVAINDVYMGTEDEVLSVSVADGLLSNDTDADINDVLTVTDVTPVTTDNTPIAIQGTGSFDFVATTSVVLNALDEGETFTSVYSYIVDDGNSGTATATFSVVVSGVNDAPTAVDDTGQGAEADLIMLSPLENDSDAEGHSLNIVAVEVPGNGSATVSTDGQLIEYLAPNDLSEGEVRQEQVIYTVSDGSLTSQATVLVEVTGRNDAPIIQQPTASALPPLLAGAGPVELDVLSSISDDSADLTVTDLDATGTLGNVFLGSVFYDSLDAFVYLNVNETATDSFGFTVEDTEGLTSTGQFIVTITGEADAPIAGSPISATFSEDDAVNMLDLTIGVTDPDITDSFTITNFSATGNSEGLMLVGNDLTINPDAYNSLSAGGSSTTVFNYDVVDTTGLSVAHSASVTFTGVNDSPTIPVQNISMLESDADFSIDLLLGAMDVEMDTLSITNLVLLAGDDSGIAESGNTLDVSPVVYSSLLSGEQEIIEYSFDVTDANGGVTSGSLNLVITGSNVAPFTTPISETRSETDTLFTVDLLQNAVDPDLDPLTVTTLTLLSGDDRGIVRSGSDLDIDPAAYSDLVGGEIENISYTYVIGDGAGGTTTGSFDLAISGVNSRPITTPINLSGTDNDANATVDLLQNAFDPEGDPLSVINLTLISGNSAGVALGVNSLTVDFSAYDALQVGDSEILVYQYDIDDASGGVTFGDLTFTINGANDAPSNLPIAVAVTEGDPLLNIDLLQNAVDAELDPLSIINLTLIAGNDVGATNVGSVLDVESSQYEYLGDGTTEILDYQYDVIDGQGGSITGDVNIVITGVNDLPTSLDTTVTATEDTTYVFGISDFGFTDIDVLDQLQGITVTTLSARGDLQLNGSAITSGQVIARADILAGVFTFVPVADENGTNYDAFTYTVSDGLADSTVPAMLAIDVTAVNNAPTASDTIITATEDTNYVFGISDFGFTDVDASDQLQGVTVTTLSSRGDLQLNGSAITSGQVIARADILAGVFTFVPIVDENGASYDAFTYTVSDGLADSTVPAMLAIDVTPVNDTPTSFDTTITATEDATYVFGIGDFGFSDSDALDQLQSLTVTTLSSRGDLELNGSAIMSGQIITLADILSGVFTFVPIADENGASYDSFTYTVSDGLTNSTVPAMLAIDVTPVNDTPTSVDTTVTATEDATYVFGISDFGFTDVDASDQLQGVTVTTLSSSGDLQLNGGAITSGQVITSADILGGIFTFVPIADENGASYDAFTYTVSDGLASSAVPSMLAVDVTAVNDNPVALGDAYNTIQNTSITTSVGLNDLLLNDTDLDFDVLMVDLAPVVDVTDGALTLAADGTFNYSPDLGFVGSDSFVYRVTDGNGGTDTATVSLDVSLSASVFQAIANGAYSAPGTWDQGLAPDINSTILLNSAFTVTQSAGVEFADNISLTASGAEFIISGGTLDVTNSIAIGAGSIFNTTGGALTSGGSIANAGSLVFDGGSIDAVSIVNASTISDLSGVVTIVNGDLINNGAISLVGVLQGNGDLDNQSGGTVELTGQTSNQFGKTVQNRAGGVFTINGATAATALIFAADFVNAGMLNLTDSVSDGFGIDVQFTAGSSLINQVGGVVNVQGTLENRAITGDFVNQGSFNLSHNASLLNNGFNFDSQSGVIDILVGRQLTVDAGVGAGTVTLGTGTSFTGDGTVSFVGTQIINLSSDFTLDNTVLSFDFNSGAITVNGPGNFINQGLIGFEGADDVFNTQYVNDVGGTTSLGGLASSIFTQPTFNAGVSNASLFQLGGGSALGGDQGSDLLLGGAATFVNQATGVLQTIGNLDNRSISGNVTNLGLIDVDRNVTVNNDGKVFDTSAGTLDIASGETLLLSSGAGGDVKVADTTVIAGAGTIDFQGANTLSLGADFTFSSTTVFLDFLNGATLIDDAGAGFDFINTGDLTVQSADEIFNVAVMNTGSGQFFIGGINSSVFNAPDFTNGLTNTSNILLGGGSALGGDQGSDLVVSGGVFLNQAGATLQSLGTLDSRSISAEVVNLGTIDVDRNLSIKNQGHTFDTVGGILDVESGSTLLFVGGTGGSINVDSSTQLLGAGVIDFSGTNTLSLLSDFTFSSTTLDVNFFNGLVTVDDGASGFDFFNSGDLTIQSADDIFSVLVENLAAGQLNIGGISSSVYNAPTFNGGLRNAGTITLGGGSALGADQGSELIVNSGTFENLAGATLLASGSLDGRFISADVINQGTVDVQQSLTVNNQGRAFDNTQGTVIVGASETLTFDGGTGGNIDIDFASTFSGDGTLSFDGTNLINVISDFTFSSNTLTTDFTGGQTTFDDGGSGFTLFNTGTLLVQSNDEVFDVLVDVVSGGQLLLGGTTSSEFTSPVFNDGLVNSGLIVLGGGNGLGGDQGTSISVFGGFDIGAGSTLRSSGTLDTRNVIANITNNGLVDVQRDLTITTDGHTFDTSNGTVDVANSQDLTFAGATGGDIAVGTGTGLTGSGALVFTGINTVTLGSDFTFGTNTLTTDFSGGTTTFDDGGAGFTFFNDATLLLQGTGVVFDAFFDNKLGSQLLVGGNTFASLTTSTFNLGLSNSGQIDIQGGSGLGGDQATNLNVVGGMLTNETGGVINVIAGVDSRIITASVDNQGLIELNKDLTIDGALNSTGAVNLINSDLTITGGNLFSNGGTLTAFTGVNGVVGTFDNSGGLFITGSDFGNATFNINGFINFSGATVELDTASTMSSARIQTLNVNSGILNNQGTIVTTNTGGMGGNRIINANITNTASGVLDVNEDLRLDTLAFDARLGTIDVANLATLTISGGGITQFSSATSFGTGTGTILFNETETLEITGLVTFSDPASGPQFDFGNSSQDILINGTGDLTIDVGASIALTDDDIATAGLFNNGLIEVVQGGGNEISSTLFNNMGAVSVKGDDTNNTTLVLSTTVQNLFGGQIEIDTASATSSLRTQTLTVTAGIIDNQGTIISSNTGGMGGTRIINADISNSATGSLVINEDLRINTIAFDASLGSIDVAAGATLRIIGGGLTQLSSATVFGAGTGTILFDATETLEITGPVTIPNAAAGPQFEFGTSSSDVTINGTGDLIIDSGASIGLTDEDIATAGLFNNGLIEVTQGFNNAISSLLFNNQGILSVQGDNISNAALTLTTTVQNLSGGQIVIDTASTTSALRTQTLTVTGGNIIDNQGSITSSNTGGMGGTRNISADITNTAASGSLDINEDLNLTTTVFDASLGTINVADMATLRIVGGGTTTFSSATAFTGTGTILFDATETVAITGPVTIPDATSGPQFDFGTSASDVTINGTGDLIIDASASIALTDENIATAGLFNDGLVEVTQGFSNSISSVVFNNQGILSVQGDNNTNATLTLATSVQNLSGGQIVIDTASTTSALRTQTLTVTGGNTIDNQGSITSSNTGGMGGDRIITADITNTASGSLDITENLRLNTTVFDASLGTINIADMATLRILGGGTTMFSPATVFTGTGTILFDANETIEITGPVNIPDSASGLKFDFGSSAADVTINGTGDLNIDPGGRISLTDENIATAVLYNDGLIEVTQGFSNTISSPVFDNEGILSVKGDDNNSATLSLTTTVDNLSLGQIDIDTASTTSASRTQILTVTGGIIDNSGSITSSNTGGMGGTRIINADITNFFSGASLDINEDLSLNTTVFDASLGTVNVADMATLRIIGGGTTMFSSATNFAGTGTILFDDTETIEITGPVTIPDGMSGLQFDFGTSSEDVTINGTGDLIVGASASIALTDENIATAGLFNEGLIEVTQGFSNAISSPLFDNQGILSVQGDDNNSATLSITTPLQNLAGGQILIDTASTTSGARTQTLNASTSMIDNHGVITSSNSGGMGGTRNINGDIDNAGLVDVRADLSLINGQVLDNSRGTIKVDPGVTLEVLGGTIILSEASALMGAGTIEFGGVVTAEIFGDFDLTALAPIFDTAGSVNFVGPGSLRTEQGANLVLTNDDVSVDFVNEGQLTSIGNNIDITGSFMNTGDVLVDAEGSTSGILQFSNGFISTGNITIDQSTANNVGSEVRVLSGTLSNIASGVILATDTNGGMTTANHVLQGSVVNDGLLDVDASLRLNLAGGEIFDSTNGHIDVAVGATLSVDAGILAVSESTEFSGAGTIEFMGTSSLDLVGNYEFKGGETTFDFSSGATTFTGANLIIGSDAVLEVDSNEFFDNSNLDVKGQLVVVGTGNSAAVTTGVASGGSLVIDAQGNSNAEFSLNFMLTTNGDLVLDHTIGGSGHAILTNTGSITNSGTITVVDSVGDLGATAHEINAGLNNTGALIVDHHLDLNGASSHQNGVDGVIDIAAGKILKVGGSSSLDNSGNGMIQGSGILSFEGAATFIADGGIAPGGIGNTPTTLTIENDAGAGYAGGNVTLYLDVANAGSADLLVIDQIDQMNTNYDVNFLSGHGITSGQFITVVDYTTYNVGSPGLISSNLSAGYDLNINNNTTTNVLELQITSSFEKTFDGVPSSDLALAANYVENTLPEGLDDLLIDGSNTAALSTGLSAFNSFSLEDTASLTLAPGAGLTTNAISRANLGTILNFTGGSFTSNSILTVDGFLTWGNAAILGNGVLALHGTSDVTVESGTGLDQKLENYGNLTISEGGAQLLSGSGAIINAEGGTASLNGTLNINQGVNNHGTFLVESVTGDTDVQLLNGLLNSGTIILDDNDVGTARATSLSVGGPGFENSGIIRFQDTSGNFGVPSLEINSGLNLTNFGTIELNGANANIKFNDNNLDLRGGTIDFGAGEVSLLDLTNTGSLAQVLLNSETTFTGDGVLNADVGIDLVLDGSFVLESGVEIRLDNSARIDGVSFFNFDIEAGASLLLRDGSSVEDVLTLNNEGDVFIEGANVDIFGDVLNGVNGMIEISGSDSIATDSKLIDGLLENDGTIKIDLFGGATNTLEVSNGASTGTLINGGLIEVLSASGAINLEARLINSGTLDIQNDLLLDGVLTDGAHSNNGTINIGAGSTFTLGASETFQNSGELKGSGTLDLSNGTSTFGNNGVITPGDGAVTGILTINGAAFLQENSELQFDLGGTTAGTQYDVLNFVGAATALNGRLRVNTTFSPIAGNTFSIIATGAALTGDFTQIQGLDFSTGVVLEYQEIGMNIDLAAVAVDLIGTAVDDLQDATTVMGTITGGLGNDDIFGVSTGDTVYGQDGDDIIRADLGFERIDGGDGVDTLELNVATADFIGAFVPAHLIDQIEILSLEGNGLQVIQLDATAITQIVDGSNSFTGFDNDLFIVGDEGDLVQLTGDFVVDVSVYLDPQNNGVGERFSVVEHQNDEIALFVDESIRLDVTRGDSSLVQLGGSGDETLTGSTLGDHLDGRLGIDSVDGGAGDDTLVYDALDTLIDGGVSGLDTLLLADTIDLTGVTNLDNIEVLDLTNGYANEVSLDIGDILNWVTDNELDTFGIIAGPQDKIVITGDEFDNVLLDGQDLSDIVGSVLPNGITSTFTPLTDPIGDGNNYISFFNMANSAHLLVNALLVDPDPVT